MPSGFHGGSGASELGCTSKNLLDVKHHLCLISGSQVCLDRSKQHLCAGLFLRPPDGRAVALFPCLRKSWRTSLVARQKECQRPILRVSRGTEVHRLKEERCTDESRNMRDRCSLAGFQSVVPRIVASSVLFSGVFSVSSDLSASRPVEVLEITSRAGRQS